MTAAFTDVTVLDAVIVEQTVQFTLADLCRACETQAAELVALVHAGVLQPLPLGTPTQTPMPAQTATSPDAWRFDGAALPRARSALRLAGDLQLGVEATALVVDLLDEITLLRTRLRRAGLD